MKIGTYLQGKCKSLMTHVFLAKSEFLHLSHKATTDVVSVSLVRNGADIVMRRAYANEPDVFPLYIKKEVNRIIQISAKRFIALHIGKQWAFKAIDAAAKVDFANGIPIIKIPSSSFLGVDPVLGERKEREVKPLYHPEDHPPLSLSEPGELKKSDPIQVDPTVTILAVAPPPDFKELLNWVNEVAEKAGAELLIIDGKVRAKITTII